MIQRQFKTFNYFIATTCSINTVAIWYCRRKIEKKQFCERDLRENTYSSEFSRGSLELTRCFSCEVESLDLGDSMDWAFAPRKNLCGVDLWGVCEEVQETPQTPLQFIALHDVWFSLLEGEVAIRELSFSWIITWHLMILGRTEGWLDLVTQGQFLQRNMFD